MTDCGTVLWPELGSECCPHGGPDVFSVLCFFHCTAGDSELQSKCGTDRGTVLWPELGSECYSLGGPDLFSVPYSFQCSDGDSELQSQC